MPDVPVLGFVLWRDTAADPPEYGTRVLVDPFGPALTRVFAYRSGLDDKYKMWSEPHDTLDPQPSVWCDPSPPDMSDPLTVEDMRYALQSGIADAEDDATLFHVCDPNGDGEQVFARRAARLRRALEQIGNT